MIPNHVIEEVDEWLDDGVTDVYKEQPLAQDWARVAKIGEELGEAIDELIAATGQNPRKPMRADAGDKLLMELADVVITAQLAIQHFTKDVSETQNLVSRRAVQIHARMRDVVEAAA